MSSESSPLDPLSAEEFFRLADVSRETAGRLLRFDAVLMDWSGRHNLVARSTLSDRWRRHYLDSAQLFPLLPKDARRLVDLGSGAGFPGIMLAAMGAARGLAVTLVESTQKKAAFLAEAARAMDLTVEILPARIETLARLAPDVITARALAPLPLLLGYAHRLSGADTKCLFLKGQDVEKELTDATKYWSMTVTRTPSLTSAQSSILAIASIAPRGRTPHDTR